jgi:uncharacterized protein (DUF2252 family)
VRGCAPVVETDLRAKHAIMRNDAFMFFRGTYYQWVQQWPEVCAELCRTPTVLAVDDLHVGSYGTWRDAEGRLVWAVDDFDDSYPLPYTNDLVRLATSVKIAMDRQVFGIKLHDGCDAILKGYRRSLVRGGRPFVLAEHFEHFEKLGLGAIKPANNFWEKLEACRTVRHGVPRDASRALRRSLPSVSMEYRIVRRAAGMGSRGQRRFVAIADREGGRIAREAKAMVPSASQWLNRGRGCRQSYCDEVLKVAVRSHDPFQRISGRVAHPPARSRFEPNRHHGSAERAGRGKITARHGGGGR